MYYVGGLIVFYIHPMSLTLTQYSQAQSATCLLNIVILVGKKYKIFKDCWHTETNSSNWLLEK